MQPSPEPPPSVAPDFDSLPDVGFPLWVRAAALVVVLLVLFSLFRLPNTLRASVEQARGDKYYAAGQWAKAAQSYELAEEVFPTSTKVSLPLAESYLRAGMPAEAAEELHKMVGEEVEKEDYDRATQVQQNLSEIADKLKSEGRPLTDEAYKDSMDGKPAPNKGGK